MTSAPQPHTKALGPFLENVWKDFHRADFLYSDPLEFVHRYSDPHDQEVVALLSALLAYGNVKQIKRSIQDALNRMQSSPAHFVRGLPKAQEKSKRAFATFVHRFNVGNDIIALFNLLNKSWQHYGSLGGHFLSFLNDDDIHIEGGLTRFINDWRKMGPEPSFLLTSPESGSCCKRWCMLLRWMGRKDKVDIGLWTSTSPLAKTFQKKSLKARQLIMPLDTHTGRICQYLGLSSRKSVDWKAAVEVTENLKRIDPTDPTRYDFALARLGILDLCQKSYRKEICHQCQLLPVCHFAQKHSRGPLHSTRYSA